VWISIERVAKEEQQMELLSVNVSLGKEVTYKSKTVTTGIFKEPVDDRVMLRTLNLDGDRQIDLKGHGGPFKEQSRIRFPIPSDIGNLIRDCSLMALSNFSSSKNVVFQ
jgi:hypothetical protein